MSRFLLVNDGDYKIKVQPAGNIILDTSPIVENPFPGDSTYNAADQGSVIITGNLIVQGETTTVNTTEMTVEDRVITLNSLESGAGITDIVNPAIRHSGLEISRGSLPKAEFLFDEYLRWYDSQINDWEDGAFVLKLANGRLVGLRTNSITTNGEDLNLLGENLLGDGREIVSVRGTVDYEEQVIDYTSPGRFSIDDDIVPNILAVSDLVYNFYDYKPPFKIQDFSTSGTDNKIVNLLDTLLTVNDSQRADPTRPNISVSNMTLTIDGAVNAEWFTDSHLVQDFKIYDNVIETTNSNVDLILRSPGTGSVQIDDNLKMIKMFDDPAMSDIGVKVYAKEESVGQTGLFFVNKTIAGQERRDELISRNKAFVFSMIF
jgi:hypothetical protein